MIIKTYEDCSRAVQLLGIDTLDAEYVAAAHSIESPDEHIPDSPGLRKFIENLGASRDERNLLTVLLLSGTQPDLPTIAATDARDGSDLLLGELFESFGARQDIAAEAVTLPSTLAVMGDGELRKFLLKSLDEHRHGDFMSPSHDFASVQVDAALRELCRRLPEPA